MIFADFAHFAHTCFKVQTPSAPDGSPSSKASRFCSESTVLVAAHAGLSSTAVTKFVTAGINQSLLPRGSNSLLGSPFTVVCRRYETTRNLQRLEKRVGWDSRLYFDGKAHESAISRHPSASMPVGSLYRSMAFGQSSGHSRLA